MKKFVWRLQRVLEIRIMQEQKARVELFALTQKLAATRGELIIQRKILENLINDLSSKSASERLAEQELFMKNSASSNEKIKQLVKKVQELETQQKQKIAEIVKLRQAKEGMEKLRAEAQEEYIKVQEKLEQKQMDEEASIMFVRNHN